MTDASTVPATLRREWAVVAAAMAFLSAGGAWLLASTVDGDTAALLDLVADLVWLSARGIVDLADAVWIVSGFASVRWLLPVVVVAGFQLLFVYRHLGSNRPYGDGVSVYRSLGLPNLVTLSRGGLVAALAGFGALTPRPAIAWLPALLYGVGVTLDLLDGFLARRTERTTVLGAKLDMAIDTTGFLVAPLVGVLWGQLPAWYLSLSAARYLFKLGCAIRRRRGKPVFALPPSRVRRPLAGVQMGVITLALMPIVPLATIRPLAAVVLAASLSVFVRDYLAVVGVAGGADTGT
jgi:CDP-diacylglycerol--glycerol-3-phosphate 3-phosphatidyltransferase